MAKEKIKKPIYKRVWFWVLAVIIVFAIAGGTGDDDSQSEQESAKSSQQSSASNDEKSKEKVEKKEKVPASKDNNTEVTLAKIGEPASIGDVTFTVNNAEESTEIKSGNQFIENATTSGKFVIADVTIKNDKSEAITIDSSYFKLKTPSAEFDPATSGEVIMAMGDANDFFLEQINPGLEKNGKVVFEVGADVDLDSATLKTQTGFWGTESIEISLSK